MKNLYLPVEIKQRELVSLLLISAEAIKLGFRVYLGSHAALNSLLRNSQAKNGVYLDKSFQPLETMEMLSLAVERIVIMDIELSPILESNELNSMIPQRIYQDTRDFCVRYYVATNHIKELALNWFPEHIVKVVGWPRFNVAHQHSLSLYATQAQRLSEKFGTFLVFASGYRYLVDPRLTTHLKAPGIIQQSERNTLEYKIENFNLFKNAVKLLRLWDQNAEVPTIVVKPHPSENPKHWVRALKGARKTLVYLDQCDNSSYPLIMASQGVIHSGSTLSLEAKILGKSLYFSPSSSLIRRHHIARALSEFSVDEISHPTIVNSNIKSDSSKVRNNPYFDVSIVESILQETSLNSAKEIAMDLSGIATNDSDPFSRSYFLAKILSRKSAKRAVGLIRDEALWKLGKLVISSQANSIPGGISSTEIKHILDKISIVSLKVRQIGINLVEISKT